VLISVPSRSAKVVKLNPILTCVHGRVRTLALMTVSSAMLSWVALFNHSPLVFPDSLSYATTALLREIPGMFSPYYSIFILPFHQGVTLWPVVLMQAVILSHLLWLVIRCVTNESLDRSDAVLTVTALCLFSSLPWFVGQIMPDVFSPVVLIGIFLLGFCREALKRGELTYVCALTTAAIATHLSHIPIALGLILLCLVFRLVLWPTRIKPMRWAVLLLIPPMIAGCSILAINWVNSRDVALARNSNVFLLAKWIEEGPAMNYLDRACPDAHYSLCPYLDELRGRYQDGLKWFGGSPFYKVGGFDKLEPEARQIVWATLRTYPGEILQNQIKNIIEQLQHFDVGEGMGSGSVGLVAPYIGKALGPEAEQSLHQAKQATDDLPIAEFRVVHDIGLVLGFGLALWTLIVGGRRLPKKLLALYAFVVWGILWNAVVTASLSGPFDRYLARIIWLVDFAGLVGFLLVIRMRTFDVAPGSGTDSSLLKSHLDLTNQPPCPLQPKFSGTSMSDGSSANETSSKRS
jgi:hypothetical protein